MYTAIGFDYGGVLNHSKSALPSISKILGVSEDKLRAIYYPLNTLANVDNMSYEDLWSKIATDLGQGEKAQEVVDAIHEAWDLSYNQDMLNLIDELRAKNFKVGLLSNNTRENGDRMREDGLEKYFDVFMISAEVGYQKPSHEIFNLFCEKLDIQPSELIFTDDSESSLRLSSEIGYHPILFKNYEGLRSELTHLGILN